MRLIIGTTQSPANPLLRAVYLIVGAILLVGALFFGALIFVFVIGFAVIAAAIASVRFWWIKRKLEKAAMGAQRQGDAQPRGGVSDGGRVIEGEFIDMSDSAQSDSERRA